jgi:GTPase SAR1 family protein
MFGLDAAGKTTILYRLKPGAGGAATVATVGKHIHTLCLSLNAPSVRIQV